MNKKIRIALGICLFITVIALPIFFIATHNIDVLDPKGLIAEKQRHLLLVASSLMLVVVIPTFLMFLFFAWKYREHKGSKYSPDWDFNFIAEICWWGVPFVIIIILSIITFKTSHSLNPFKPLESDKKPIEIQVVALQWKWLFIYPEYGIATVNYIEFPKDTPVNFEITADAPMNSFWIPQLGGQIYAMPAMRSKLHLMAGELGSYRGVSANISGSGFAGMVFTAKATTDQEFKNWISSVRGSTKSLGMMEYENLVLPTEYVPVSYYRLQKNDLFDAVIMKYKMPSK